MSNYLEIDSKILEKNLLLQGNPVEPGNLDNLFGSPGNYLKENAPWKLVEPTAGFCVKTSDAQNKKVFINVCKLDEIPEPKDITEAELLELWESDDVPDYRIPLSIQEPHEEFDKSGNPTVAYDVAVNTKFFKKIQSNVVFRSFVMQVVLEGLENKYGVELKKEGFVILQNRRCLGELKPHRIRVGTVPGNPSKPLIEELPSTAEKTPPNARTAGTRGAPAFRLFENALAGVVVGEFHLPKLGTSKDLNLDVGDSRLVLESQRGCYLADIFIPFKIDETGATARFNANSKILTVRMPVKATA